MRQIRLATLAAACWLFISGSVLAGPIGDIKSTLTTTRQHTMGMLGEDDRAVLEMRQEEAMKSSKDLDNLLAAAMKNESLRANQATLAKFKVVWDEFKKTRDNEIIPMLFAGDRLKARYTALTTQAPRFKKMNELLDSMPQ